MRIFVKHIKVFSLCCVFVFFASVLSGCEEDIEKLTHGASTEQHYVLAHELVQDAIRETVLDFVTQPVDNLDRIVVILDWDERRTIYITEQPYIEYLYNLIRETTVISIEKHPGHSTHPMWGSQFEIKIEYQSGDIDEIFTAENPELVLRLLDTRGGSGDRGFVLGINEKLWEYIFNLEND